MPDKDSKYIPMEPGLSKEQGKDIVEHMGAIEGFVKRWKERDRPILISIPETESNLEKGIRYFTMVPGVYAFNFYHGEIVAPLPVGKSLMSNALKNYKREYMRSLRFFTDQDIIMSFEQNENTMIIGGETISLKEQQFQTLYITAFTNTNVRIMASTGDGMFEFDMITALTTHSPLYDVDSSVAQVVILDLGILSRTQVEIAATATVATPFVFEASMDNSHWFTIESFGAATTLHKGYMNAFRYLKLRSIPAGGKLSMLITARGM